MKPDAIGIDPPGAHPARFTPGQTVYVLWYSLHTLTVAAGEFAHQLWDGWYTLRVPGDDQLGRQYHPSGVFASREEAERALVLAALAGRP